MSDNEVWNQLSAEQRRVIVDRGTEPAFSGPPLDQKDGTFTCARCSAPLFVANSKFDSGCGWPSFDESISGAVRELPDPDGRRVEIRCMQCDGHLGHVFRGERATAKDTRHCVNSLSIDFDPGSSDVAFFAGGCFWGVEHELQQIDGVSKVESGYMGGAKSEPTYKEVCSGTTGHTETVRVTYDPARVSFETLAKVFFELHDPTQVDRQGPDVGSQYRSAVFFLGEEQERITQGLIETLKSKGLSVATEVSPAGLFWPAEEYHQDYIERTRPGYVCHQRVPRF